MSPVNHRSTHRVSATRYYPTHDETLCVFQYRSTARLASTAYTTVQWKGRKGRECDTGTYVAVHHVGTVLDKVAADAPLTGVLLPQEGRLNAIVIYCVPAAVES
jgi:hypothetical protein